MEAQPADARGRILIAAITAVVLVAIIVVVAVASGGESDEGATVVAPQRCLVAWNPDESARAYGRHNFGSHLYESALVTFLNERGEQVGEWPGRALRGDLRVAGAGPGAGRRRTGAERGLLGPDQLAYGGSSSVASPSFR